MAYLETPHTDIGNATFMTNGHRLEDFSVENSFVAPSKSDDLLSHMRNGRGFDLKTPRTRSPLTDRRNLPNVPKPGEFTPLLKSVTKKNYNRSNTIRGVPQTPAFLKDGYKEGQTPALPGTNSSRIYGEETGSLAGADENGTPVLHVASSSAQSTPLALPQRDAGGILTAEGNALTLREQENIINKIEKENFGLKLKIHFLDETLKKAGPGYNAAALKENTDLKVDKITMQKELAQARKTLVKTERELEQYRLHLQEVRNNIQRKHLDENLQHELESLRDSVAAKDHELAQFRQQTALTDAQKDEAEKLRGDLEDLEAGLQEKDRLIEDRDDEIDRLKDQAQKYSNELAETHDQLEVERQRAQDVQEDQEDHARMSEELREMRNDLGEALAAKKKAEEDLEELQDEMANKSVHTKGLSRQLEDKAQKLHSDLAELRTKHADLQNRFDDQSRELKRSQGDCQSAKQDAEDREERLQDQYELLRHDSENAARKCESLTKEVQKLCKDLQAKSDDKDLLHSRHDALTVESHTLQKDLSKARSKVEELEESLDEERQRALENDRQVRSEAKDEIDRLSDEVNSLRRDFDNKMNEHNTDRERWRSQQRDLQSQRERSHERAAGLQRTVNKLQETEGTLTDRESNLQQALESEKQRHRSETGVLERQIRELNFVADEKRQAIEDFQTQLSQTKEELRNSVENQSTYEDRNRALEDEIDVLQTSLDEETEQARLEIEAAQQEAEALQCQLHALKQQSEGAEQAQGSSDEVGSRLRDLNYQLETIRSDKGSLQDRLAATHLEIQSLRTTSAHIKAERDEMKGHLQQMQNQVDETFRLEQEKVEMRTSKLKLENDVHRLHEERKGLIEKKQSVERELEAEIERAKSDEARLSDEVTDLQRKLAFSSDGRDRELQSAKQKVQRLEQQVEILDTRSGQGDQDAGHSIEMSVLQKDMGTARRKEIDYLQREAAYKDTIRELKQHVAHLERQVHEIEISRLAVDTPKSSDNGSARKTELLELRRQLFDAQHQLKDLRTRAKESERSLQRRLLDSERQAHAESEAFDQQRDQLAASLSDCRAEMESHISKNSNADKTISRLRTRIQNLESSLQIARVSTTVDQTMAEERKDLHEMLKDAKLSTENLQLQIVTRQSLLDAAASREKDLRAQLQRVREGRTVQSQKSSALASELDHLQETYEATLDKFTRKQQQWEAERKRVRFPNVSVSEGNSQMEAVVKENDKRHAAELNGLAKQIQWLRAKLGREEGFRLSLAWEKRWLTMRCEMFEACNAIDLDLLRDMGLAPEKRPKSRKPPTLRVVATMVLASCRMKKWAHEWSEQKKLKASLVRGLENMKAKGAQQRKSSMK